MSRLETIASQIESQANPPVHLWQPQHHGEIDIEIDHLGRWFHEGGQIKRPELVRLFASILWHEDGQYYLVTPAEKLKIKVADCPLLVETAEKVEDVWVVTTNTKQQVIVGRDNPVELRAFQNQNIPYVNIRYDLWARISRAVYYQWAELALHRDGEQEIGLWSGDYFFNLG